MFTKDIVFHRFGEARFSERQKVLIARGFILAIVTVTYALAVYLKDSAHVFDLGVWCFTGFAALFPLVFAAVYWKGVTLAGAFASIIATAVGWTALFSRDILAKKPDGMEDELLIYGMMPVTILIAISALILVSVSLMTRKPSRETIERFFG